MGNKLNRYFLNQTVRVTSTFTVASVLTDPTTVTVKYMSPTGTITTKVYPTDPEVVKSSTGVYYLDILANDEGDWHYSFVGDAPAAGAFEGRFNVKESVFD